MQYANEESMQPCLFSLSIDETAYQFLCPLWIVGGKYIGFPNSG